MEKPSEWCLINKQILQEEIKKPVAVKSMGLYASTSVEKVKEI